MPDSKFTVYDIFNRYINSKATFSDEELERIKSLTTIKKLRKKQYLLQEGCFRIYQVDEKGMEHILKSAIENWWAADAESIVMRLPQGMIASYLGITPETLSRVRKLSAGK